MQFGTAAVALTGAVDSHVQEFSDTHTGANGKATLWFDVEFVRDLRLDPSPLSAGFGLSDMLMLGIRFNLPDGWSPEYDPGIRDGYYAIPRISPSYHHWELDIRLVRARGNHEPANERRMHHTSSK